MGELEARLVAALLFLVVALEERLHLAMLGQRAGPARSCARAAGTRRAARWVVISNRSIPMRFLAPLPRAALCALAALALSACDRSIGVPGSPSAASDAAPPAQKPASAPAVPAPSKTADRAPRSRLPDRAPSDSEITARAASAMRSDPALAGADFSVSTNHGVVSLTGTVRSPEQLAAAEERAQSPSGVMRVDSHLSVDPEH
ncbi:MAG TPA: BON domain-containing protein [Usitatibacter sp.]|nr:BON domain-containing protein [Usitatibacter sp.]